MVAYQMIYTACGKDKSGAFSVWAKSANVTKTECDEIVKLMSYRKPQNVPYEPTEEEIRTLFPKKYGYFVLSSGRICLAQTSYIGKVYSDLDARNGNFIIHAYITDELSGINPFGIIGSDIFKTNLSYQEWHDSEAPSDLPSVELSIKPNVDESVIRKYLLGNQRKEVASFLQAVIDASNSGTSVTFNDTEENQAQLYSLLGMLIPANLFNKITFSNQYSTQLDYAMSSSSMQPLLLRNIFSGMINTAFNYQEQLDSGQVVFYFEKEICSYVEPKRYLTDIIQSLENGNSLFSVLKKIDAVNKIMNDTNCDVDKAIAIYYLTQLRLDWFSGATEYSQALESALVQQYIDKVAVADCLYKDIILTGKWGRGSDILSLIRFAYENNDEGVKANIMEHYFNNLPIYGVNVASIPTSVLTQVKGNAPFPWDDFAMAVARDRKWEGYIDKNINISCLYFVFEAAVLAIAKNLTNVENQYTYGLLVKILKKSVSRKNLDEIQLYLGLAKNLGDQSLSWLIETAFGEYLNQAIRDETTLDFVFRFVCAIDNEQEKIKLIGKLIAINMQTAFFMQTYIKYSDEQQSLFLKVENAYKSDEYFSKFLFRKDAYVFKTATKITLKSLDDYFNKYYRAGYDSGVYCEKIKQYISAQEEKVKISECLKIYDQIKALPDSFADVITIISYLDKEIFSMPMDALLDSAVRNMNSFVEINRRLMAVRVTLPEKYEIMRTILLVRGKLGEDICQDCIQRNALYSSLNNGQLTKYVDEYFGDVLNLYCSYKKKGVFKTKLLLVASFERVLSSSRHAQDSIIQALEKLNGKDYYDVMADIMAYAFNGNDRFASELMNFVRSYIDKMSRGDYKKLFKKVLELLPQEDVAAVKKYIDKYLDEHMSFIEKIFSKKNKE